MTLWVLCEHGSKGPHPMKSGSIDLRWSCPGGREATIEDVKEALGGQRAWLCVSTFAPRCDEDAPDPMGLGGHDSCGWFILTPALDQEAPR